jgi:predicted metal-dependent TIM-barrel fold hydrolase
MRFFDAHLHADCRSSEELETMSLFGTEAAVTLSVGAGLSARASVLDYWDRLARSEPRRAARFSLRLGAGRGLHPAAADRDNREALESLSTYLAQPGVVALGELGLETGSAEEVALLRAQLTLSNQVGLPVVLHTPEENKLAVTRQLLGIVEQAGLGPGVVLVDHVAEESLEAVRASGCWIGLTVHPRSLTPQRATGLLELYGPERVVLSSDVGRDPADLWSLPRTALECRRLGLGEVAQPAFYDNACAFYGFGGPRW